MEGQISLWRYKEQESNLILPEHDDDDDNDNNQLNYSNIEVHRTLQNLHNTNTAHKNQFDSIHLLFVAIYFRYLKGSNNRQNGTVL